MKPANLSFSTLPCEGWSPEQLAAACRMLGFAGLELRVDDSSWIHAGMSDAARKQYAALFAAAGIAIIDIGTSICVKGGSGVEFREQYSALERHLQLAADFRAKGIRIFLGNFARRFDAPKERIDHADIVRFLQAACAAAKPYGLGIWVETHNEYATGAVLRPLIDEVGRDNLGIIWDVLHPLEDGEPPETTVSLLHDRIVHVHMKDGIPSSNPIDHDWKYTVIGEGSTPLRDIVTLLSGIGYTGSYSLEWETKWRTELQAPHLQPKLIFPHYVAFMERLLTEMSGGIAE